MDIQFMKDYYDLRYEETDGENHFVEETAYQEKQSEQSKMEDQLMEMVGGTESNVWKLYESIMPKSVVSMTQTSVPLPG